MTFQGAIQAHGNPAGWPEVELRSVVRQRKEFEQPDLPLLGVSVASGVRPRTTDDGRQAASLDLSAYKVVHPGDVIMNALGKPHGSIGVSTTAGVTSPAYWVLEVSGEVSRFVHYLLRSPHMVNEYQRLGKYLPPNQFDIPWETFRSVAIPLPGLDEQRRIADFLDDQVSRIDAITEASKGQISLLDERVAEAILSAVRGDDMPDQGTWSGLRWLGNVPESWPVLTVGSQFEVLLGKMLDEKRNDGTQSVPYLRNTNVQWDRVNVDDLKEMDIAPAERHRFLVRRGDLLICEGGQPGRAAIWTGPCEEIYYQKALHRARTRGRSLPRWLFYCLRAAVGMNAFAGENGQTTIGHLTSEQLRGQRLPFPAPSVQGTIVAALDAYQDEAKHLVAALSWRIKFLQERKGALITAAVTGEFDVSTASGRNFA